MIFLVHTAAPPEQILAAGLVDDLIELAPGLLAIGTDLTRSKLYHGVKALQPKAAPLLATELTEVPKIKGMAPGSLSWMRHRLG